jgi:site-specific recombinase XerD
MNMVTAACRHACKSVDVYLRHTFTFALVQKDVDLYRVQRLLGYRDGRMTQRDAHLALENCRRRCGRLRATIPNVT